LNDNIYGTFAEIGAGKKVGIFLDQVDHLEPLQKQCQLMTRTLVTLSME
jgi:hypothetical protein